MYRSFYKIICDTSFLLALVEKRLFDRLLEKFYPLEIYIPESVFKELDSLSKSKGKEMRVRPVLKILERYKGYVVPLKSVSGYPDVDVIELALRHGFIVATSDKKVRSKAIELGLKTIYIRDGELYID